MFARIVPKLQFLVLAMLVQGVAAVFGFLAVRWATVHEYALYTVMTSMAGAAGILTRAGTAYSVSELLGKTWPDRSRCGEILAAAGRMRWRVAIFVMPILIGLTAWLLMKNGAGAITVVGMCCALTLGWYLESVSRIIDPALNYAGRQRAVQSIDLAIAVFRLPLIVGLHVAGILTALTLVTLQCVANYIRIRPIARLVTREEIDVESKVTQEDAAAMLATVRRQLPTDIFFCLQGQITLAILALTASAQATAEFGALGRITQLLLPFQALNTAFFIPAFTRRTDAIGRWFLIFWILQVLPGVALTCATWFNPHWLLWLVGPQYGALQTELFWAAFAAAIANAAGAAFHLAAHRGLNRFSWVQMPWTAFVLVLSFFVEGLTPLMTAILLQACLGLGPFVSFSCDWIFQKKDQNHL